MKRPVIAGRAFSTTALLSRRLLSNHLSAIAKGEAGRVSASKALKQPHVKAYMMSQVQEQLGMSATKALNRILALSSNAKSEYVQLEASKDILDRAGFKAPDKHMHIHAGDIRVNIDLS